MQSARTQFRDNLRYARELGAIAAAVQSVTTLAIDFSDLLRAQIVLAVSALDHFVHELSRLGMIEIAQGVRPQTAAYLRFEVPLTSALRGLPHDMWIGDVVRERHSWSSFQEPDKIADAIRLISGVKLWEAVGQELGMTAQDVKTELRAVVDRRNKIAHEADMDPANPGFRWPITPLLADGAVNSVERIGEAIFKVAV